MPRRSIRAKNAQNILLKNLMDACVGALWFWATGYAFAYGSANDGNWFIGNDLFFLSSGFTGKDVYHSWFFQFAFAATAATIVSGAVAERCSMGAYAGYSAVLTGFVYPVVAHWVWSGDGWLSAFLHDPWLDVGVIDFAGCGVVHMVGGAAAGIGAKVLGPRIGRFPGPDGGGIEAQLVELLQRTTPIRGHSMPLVVLGTFLLWVGWYGFNPGSTLALSGPGDAEVAARVAVTTTLGAVAGGLGTCFIAYHRSSAGTYDVAEMCNGILAGLVSTTASCAVIEPWAALTIGGLGAVAYSASAALLLRLRVDDAVNATSVHFFGGAWGLLAPAFFARPAHMTAVYTSKKHGLLYGGDGSLLACQLAALVAITAWVALTMGPFFVALKRLGLLRVSMDEEIDGLDDILHGGSAYDKETLGRFREMSLHPISEITEEDRDDDVELGPPGDPPRSRLPWERIDTPPPLDGDDAPGDDAPDGAP